MDLTKTSSQVNRPLMHLTLYLFTSAINGHTHKLTEALPSPTVLTTTSLPAGPAALCLPIDQQQQPSSCSTEALPSHRLVSPFLPCIRGERFAAHKPSRDCWCRLHRRWIRCRGRVLLLHNGGDQGTSLSFHLQQRPAREEGVGKMLVLPLCCD